MERGSLGVCPVDSQTILRHLLRIADRRKLLAAGVGERAMELAPYLPSNYFPDIHLELPLAGEMAARASLVLDPYDYHRLSFESSGAWPACSPIPAMPEPELPKQLVGLVASDSGLEPFVACDDSWDACLPLASGLPEGAPTPVARALEQAPPLPIRLWAHVDGDRFDLRIIPHRSGLHHRFSNNPHRSEILGLLRSLGVDASCLRMLDKASACFGIPYYAAESGYQELVAMLDVSHLSLTWQGDTLVSARADLVLSDKIMGYAGKSFKPGIAYQWHITDECDQRCRHCYLFGEDARAACVTTPWDQLVRTLDQIEARCARAHAYPTLAISGGDPLLHPRFWDFAKELHRRGVSWTIMGNPFHLDLEVCRRLRRLGCFQYQLSLDGLEEYHDSLRKPGSYRATLAALGPLQEAGLETQLMATASTQNLDDILACMDIAAERHVSSFAFARYCATSPQKARDLYPSPDEYREFLLAYWNKRQAYERAGCRTTFKTKDHLFTLLRWELGEFEVPAWSKERPHVVCQGCHLGSKATICANGDLLACRRMPSLVGNIRTDDLWDVEHGEAMQRYAKVDGIERCRDCELLNWCRGCRAVGHNATGNLQAADPMCWKRD